MSDGGIAYVRTNGFVTGFKVKNGKFCLQTTESML